jgi:hypothetical protein
MLKTSNVDLANVLYSVLIDFNGDLMVVKQYRFHYWENKIL